MAKVAMLIIAEGGTPGQRLGRTPYYVVPTQARLTRAVMCDLSRLRNHGNNFLSPVADSKESIPHGGPVKRHIRAVLVIGGCAPEVREVQACVQFPITSATVHDEQVEET